MHVEIVEETLDSLADYARIPISFAVESIFRVELADGGLGGLRLKKVRIKEAYTKDYDDIADGGPLSWAGKWDISNWGFFGAWYDGNRVGGAAVAHRTAEIRMLEGKDDISALWDIRVHPKHRRRGIGSKLFDAAILFSADRGCKYMKIETQNINVPACRFYAKQGCELGAISRFAYEEYPDEVELIWYRFI